MKTILVHQTHLIAKKLWVEGKRVGEYLLGELGLNFGCVVLEPAKTNIQVAEVSKLGVVLSTYISNTVRPGASESQSACQVPR